MLDVGASDMPIGAALKTRDLRPPGRGAPPACADGSGWARAESVIATEVRILLTDYEIGKALSEPAGAVPRYLAVIAGCVNLIRPRLSIHDRCSVEPYQAIFFGHANFNPGANTENVSEAVMFNS